MTTLEQLRTRAHVAQDEYESAYAQLFRDDERQQKLYSDDEHEERVGALQRERSRKLDAVIEEVRRAVSEAEREISVLENGDPTTLLSVEELAAAAARKVFVDDDVRNLPEDSAGRLRAVLASGDRVAIFCY